MVTRTLIERLGHIEKAFDTRYQKFCQQMALRRNSELHSGESPFSGVSAEAWEREFWGAVEAMLLMQQETLESWLGAEDAKAPAKIIQQAKDALQWAVENRLARCRDDFLKTYKSEKKQKETIEGSKNLTWVDTVWEGYERHTCPACGSLGFVGGTLWNEEVIDIEDGWSGTDEHGDWDGEPPMEVVNKMYSIEALFCPVCELNLYGTKEIEAAGLPDEFQVEELRDIEYEPEYGND